MKPFCSECGKRISSYNPGTLCFDCQDKKLEAMVGGDKRYYDVRDMMEILGLDSEEQVRRKGRAGLIPGRIPGIKAHRYLKQTIDEWIRSDGRIQAKLTSPAQEDAYERCVNGDHGWLWDEQFDGVAYRTEIISELGNNIITVRYRRTCYFCGHAVEGSP